MKNKITHLIGNIILHFGVGVRHFSWVILLELKRNKFEAIRKPLGWLMITTTILWILLPVFYVLGWVKEPPRLIDPQIKEASYEEIRLDELNRELQKANERIKKLEDFDKKLEEGDKEAVRTYIMDKFGKDGKVAVAVATAESGLTCKRYQNWLNKNKTVDHGAFQINSIHLWRVGGDANKLLDCKTNIDVAYQIYKEQGFRPWVAYTNGAYKKYL